MGEFCPQWIMEPWNANESFRKDLCDRPDQRLTNLVWPCRRISEELTLLTKKHPDSIRETAKGETKPIPWFPSMITKKALNKQQINNQIQSTGRYLRSFLSGSNQSTKNALSRPTVSFRTEFQKRTERSAGIFLKCSEENWRAEPVSVGKWM